MGTLYFAGLFLVVVALFSPSSSMDPFYKAKISTVGMNHIEVLSNPNFDLKANAMIVNGEEVEDYQFPYMVSIQILEQKYKRYHICGAVLISTNKALTAAHCVDYWGGVEHFAAVGFTRLSKPGQALVRIVDVLVHPDYEGDYEGYPNDLAIVTFERHVELTDRVQLANLSTPGDPTYRNYYCYVTGWGYTEDYDSYPDELRSALLINIGRRDCKNFYAIFETPGLIRTDHQCGWLWPYSACYGDSGGPLVCNGQIVGVTSWSADCGGCYPTIFSKVSSYKEWIEDNMY